MRTTKLVLAIGIIVMFCVGLPGVTRADSGPIYFSVGMPVPTTSNNIRMTREVLTIDYTGQPVQEDKTSLVGVHARFWFRNEGKAVTQQMGFPLGREVLTGFGYYDYGFTVTADGAAVKTTSFPDQKTTSGSELTYTMWNAFQIPFAAGQTRLVDVHYKIRPRDGYFLYVLQTGRLWKGPIGDLSIDVNFGRTPAFPDLLSVQPAGYRTQGNHILWHFTDYEPEQDIEIESMDAAFWKAVRPLKEAAERTGTEAAWYRYAMALLPDNVVGAYGSTTTIAGASVPMSFVRGLQSSVYTDYVQRTLFTALNHCTHGSMQERILTAAYDAHFSYNRMTGDFLNGVDVWDGRMSVRAHGIKEQLLAGTSAAKLSADEARVLTWLEANMAGESMTGGYSLSGVHELEQAQVYAAQAGLLKNTDYQNLIQTAAAYLSPWARPRLLVNVASIPRIEVQQQKMTSLAGGPAWRARIILHFALPSAEAAVVADNSVTAQLDWKKFPKIDSKDGSITGYDDLSCGFSDTDDGDYLVILTLHGFRTAAEFQKTLKTLVDNAGTNLLDNTTALRAEYESSYPMDAARAASLQSAGYTWLQAVLPAVSFNADHGVAVALNTAAPMSNALCDKAEAELKPIATFFSTFSWAKDDQIGQMVQHNLDLVKTARGRNPTIATVTYAADGTVQHTITSGTAGNRNALTIVLSMIAGLAIGLLLGIFLPAHRRKNAAQTKQ